MAELHKSGGLTAAECASVGITGYHVLCMASCCGAVPPL